MEFKIYWSTDKEIYYRIIFKNGLTKNVEISKGYKYVHCRKWGNHVILTQKKDYLINKEHACKRVCSSTPLHEMDICNDCPFYPKLFF